MGIVSKLVLVLVSFATAVLVACLAFGFPQTMEQLQAVLGRPEALLVAAAAAFITYTVGAIIVGLSQRRNMPRSY